MKNLELKTLGTPEMDTNEMKTQNGGCSTTEFALIANKYYATGGTDWKLQEKMITCFKYWKFDTSAIEF